MAALLNAHSYFSLLRGIPSPKQLAQAAKQAGYSAIALTDHQRLSGAIEFYDACNELAVKPILGLETKLNISRSESLSIVLLAMGTQGWSNLSALSSFLLNSQNDEKAALSCINLQDFHEDLICLIGSPRPSSVSSLKSKPLNTLKELFADRLYFRLPPNPTTQTQSIAEALAINLVADWPIYYLNPDDAERQLVATAMRLNTTLDDFPKNKTEHSTDHFPSKAEFAEAYSEHPKLLATTDEIASRCNLSLPLGARNFPSLDLPQNMDANQALRSKVYAGARKRYKELNPHITQRLDHELQGIRASGYTTLFLIMEEVVSFAREVDVPTSSRGSAASSLVAHCLRITTPDPIQHNLYFERFLNPARHSPPDIDIDLCSRRRDIVIQHVYERYGADRVAMVATINRFRRRSALREVAKAHGLNSAEIKKLVDTLPYRFWGPPGALSGKKDKSPYADLAETHKKENYQQIFRHAEAFLDVPHHFSIHPGGVVIAPGKLNDLVPTQISGKGVVITQFDLDSIERVGLVKVDLLGIRGLSVLGDVADQISQQRPELGSSRLEVLDSIPDQDAATSEMIQTGNTIGCFQIESPGMRGTLKEIQSESIDDVMVALSLFRPGPLKGGLKDAFVRRHLGQEDSTQLHPALEPLLAETHGVILYQEQVLRIAHELAGFSLAESDLLRRAMSHFDPGRQMITLKQKFLAGARERSGLTSEIGERVWELMAAFAGYGFPKAHAASYALTAWRSAWCKAHYPAEFMAGVLANWGGYYGQKAYLMEARRMGLKLKPPHINYSRSQFSVRHLEDEVQLFMGLDQLRNLSRRTQKKIVQMRPYASLADFLTRVFPSKREAYNLISVGALEGLGSIPELLNELETGYWRRDQPPLFVSPSADLKEDWTDARKAVAQKEFLGVSLIDHPLANNAKKLADVGARNSKEVQ